MDNNKLTRFDVKNQTHEESALGGIPQGMNPNGQMNTVETGETKKGNFIYSNRIALDKDLVKQFNLPTYAANKSVSDASKAIEDKFKDRQDKYAQETKNTLLDRLSQAQEYLKEQESAEQQQAEQAMQANSQQVPDMMEGQIPEGMEEYAASAEQVPQEGMTEGQSINPASPIAAFGGYQVKRFDGGGLFSSMNTFDPNKGVGYSFGQGNSPAVNPGSSTATPGAPGSGPSAGGVMQAAGTAMELGKLAFGKSSQDTSGDSESANVDRAGMAVGSTMKGAQAGTAIMPGIGTAVGAVIGLGAGLLGGAKQKRDAIENTNRFAYKQNSKFSDNYAAYGGELNIDDSKNPTKKQPVVEAQTAQLPIKKINYNVETTGVKEGNLQPGYYTRVDYNNGKSDYLRPEGLSELQRMNNYRLYMEAQAANQKQFLKGGNKGPAKRIIPQIDYLDPIDKFATSSLPTAKISAPLLTGQNTSFSPTFGQKVKIGIDNAKTAISENTGEALRYAPVAMNAYQLATLKKPGGVNYQTLDNRYKPSYVDEAQMQRTVDQEANNQLAAIGQSGASQGAMRASILAAGLNKTKALGDAYANAAAQNRATDDRAQEFNRNTDLQNMANRNKAIDEERMDEAAYRGARSKLLSTIGTDVGHIGKEIADADLTSALTGYTRKGKYLVKPDGSRVTPEELAKAKNQYTTSMQTMPTLKKGDKYVDENGVTRTFKYGGYLNLKNKK